MDSGPELRASGVTRKTPPDSGFESLPYAVPSAKAIESFFLEQRASTYAGRAGVGWA